MGRNTKYKSDFKMKVVQECLDGLESPTQLGVKYNCPKRKVYKWLAQYEHYGEPAFVLMHKNNLYTHDFKRMVVEEYFAGEKSLQDLCFKYNKLLQAKLAYLEMEQELKKKVQEIQMDLVSTIRKKK